MKIREWKTKVLAIVAILLACFILDMKLRGYSRETRREGEGIVTSCIGEVIDVQVGRAEGEHPNWIWTVSVSLRILNGKYKGQKALAENIFTGKFTDRALKHGDKLYVDIPDTGSIETASVRLGEYVRTPFLLHLATGFLILMVIVGGSKGVRASLSLIVSGVFIASLLIPMFLNGYNPVLASLLIATVNAILTFMLVGGMTRKSLAGILGTLGGLITAALLASFSSHILRFTGLDVRFGFLSLGKRLWLSGESTGWNFRGLLVAGMILGASGAIMDASMAVASAIEAVKKANPKMGIMRCIASGMNVGKDEMGTMANTLIFAYIGADITLILMPLVQFGEVGQAFPFTRMINEEAMSAEIIQALTGTIGLVMAIPITAVIAGFLIGRTHDADTAAEKAAKYAAKRQWWIPVVMLIIALGTHVAYSVTRHASATQIDDTGEQIFVSEYVRARVIEKTEAIDIPSTSGFARAPARSRILKTKILGGNYRDEEVLVRNVTDPNNVPVYNIEVEPGDELILKVDGTGDEIFRALIHRYSRDGFLLYLTGFFVLLMVAIGRFQGLRTAIALGISITIVLKVLMPLIMAGYNPVLVVIGVSGFIAFTSLVIVAGFNRKTGAATIGILGGVMVASLIVLYADHKLHFIGISSSRSAIVAQFTESQQLDFRKILMAGIIMGLLGTAMDAAMAVASTVREVRRANPNMTTSQLITAGMSVGTDVLGTMANTLIFAYLGLRLILIMAVVGTSILSDNKIELISVETVAAEILRLLAGTIGLVLTIPITAVVAASWDKITGFIGFGGRAA